MRDQLRAIGIDVRANHGEVKTQCPKCSHTRKNKKDPCLSVNVDEGMWNCHHCNYSGSVKKMQPKKEYTKPQSELKNLSQPVIDWFAERGISNQTLLRYKISEGVEYMPQVQEEKKVIQYNYFLDGELVNIKSRDRDKNFKLVSGAQLIPYGIDVALENSNKEIAIVEGENDVLACYEAGIKYAVSVPNGASKGSQKLEWLDECWQIFDGKKIYIATDMDEAGISLRNELARRLGRENCYIVEMSKKDANDVLVFGYTGELADAFASAIPFPVEGIEDAGMVKDDIMALYDEGVPKGCDIGYDEHFKWHEGQVTLITGIPGHGKSTFLKNVIYRLAKQHGWKFLIYSAEEASTSFALADMYQIATGKSFFQNSFCQRITKKEIEELLPFMQEHFKYYRLDNDLDIESIIAKGREMVKSLGINGLIIDNMSTVEKSMSGQADTRHHQIKNMLNDVARFSRNYGVHVFLVAHPKKMTEVKSGVYKIPNGYDVGDSSHWFNLPDNGLTIYRNPETKQTEVYKWKIRFRHTGQLGSSFYTFDINTNRFLHAPKVNDGSDPSKFVNQPYGEKDENKASRFASLPNPF